MIKVCVTESNLAEVHESLNDLFDDKFDDSKQINSLNLENNGDTWFSAKENLLKHQLSVKSVDFVLRYGGSIRVSCYEILKGVNISI